MLKDHKPLGVYVACLDCHCCTVTSDKAAATAIWNRRSALTQLAEAKREIELWEQNWDRNVRVATERIEAEATDLRRKLEEARKALQTALVAMKLAAALPGVSDEYDFDPAIDAVTRALTSGGDNA